MGKWGPGLLQNDDDADIAADLETMFGFPLTPPFASPTPSTAEAPAFDHATTAAKLNTDGLLQRKFARILEQTFVPRSASHKRQRVAVVLGMLAMQTGAVLSDEHLMALRVLHRTLPTLEQQMQLLAALDGYANDGITRWISGSKTFAETCGEKGGKANPFWYSGLGHSADKAPVSVMRSMSCMSCSDTEVTLLRCSRCKIARYCGTACQSIEWPTHKVVCLPREKPS